MKKFEFLIAIIKKGYIFAAANDASVAQLVEHLTLNQGVQGSTPCGSTSQTLVIRWLTTSCKGFSLVSYET